MTRRKHPQLRIQRINGIDLDSLKVGVAWFPDAACAGADNPDLWFAHEVSQRDLVAAAKTICNDCPMRTECLQYATDHNIEHGIWGGLTAGERYAEQRQTKWQQRQAKFTGARRKTA